MSTAERKEKEKESRREAILLAAEAVMKEQGLYGLNLDLVAKKAQLAKGTLYLYFKNKEEILASLTIKARKLVYDQFLSITKEEIPLLEKLKKIIYSNYLFFHKHPLYFDLVSLYEANHTLNEAEELYASSEAISFLVHNLIFEAQAKGVVRKDINPMMLTMHLWASTVGTLQMIKVRGRLIEEKFSINSLELFDSFVGLFLKGIKA